MNNQNKTCNNNSINSNNLSNINHKNQNYKELIKEIETPIKAEILEKNFGTPNIYLKEYINREKRQNNEDLIIHEAISFKNSIEQYIYDTRNKLGENGELKGYCTEEEKNIMIKEMDNLMTLLYNDKEEEDLYNKKNLEEKSKNMKKIGDEIYKRYYEWNKLNEKYAKLESMINGTIEYISNVEMDLKNGKFSGLKNEDINKIKNEIKKTFVKIAEKKKLSDIKDYKNLPPISPQEIDMIINEFNNNVNKIQNEAKEKSKKEKTEKIYTL